MRMAAVIVGKNVSRLSRLLRAGSGLTYPGLVAERLHPTLIRDLAGTLEAGSLVITGTNGKTSTAKMLGDALGAAGLRVVRNESGSNMRRGIASTFVGSADALGRRLRGRIGVFEVDEASTPTVVADLAPRAVCVTNLFRDQLDRYGDLDTTAAMVRTAIASVPATTVVLNGDDPVVASLAPASGGVLRFGVDDASVARPPSGRGLNAARCPVCGCALSYSRVYYGHLGDWRCHACGAGRRPLDVAARDVVLRVDSSSFTVVAGDRPLRVDLPVAGLHNVYNALAAISCARVAGLGTAAVAPSLAAYVPAFGRAEKLEVGGSSVTLLLAKNPAGAEQSLASVLVEPGAKTVGIALNDNAADGTDVSWIWDIDFESLDLSECDLILAGGRAEDAAVRLKYAGIGKDRMQVCPDLDEAVGALSHDACSGRSAHMLATYTAMLEIRDSFAPADDRFAGLGRRMRRDA